MGRGGIPGMDDQIELILEEIADWPRDSRFVGITSKILGLFAMGREC